MKTTHFLFLGTIIIIIILAGYFVFSEKEPAPVIEESEPVIKVVEESVTPVKMDEQSYCADLRSRNADQEDSNIIVESIPDNKISDGQRVWGCVYHVSGSYGGWAPFEAQVGSFHLRDGNNEAIASGPLSVAGEDWMTRAMDSKSLQFSAIINFDQKETGTGVLFLKNENASGEPERDRTLSLPVTF